MRDVELEVAVLTEVSLQPLWFRGDLLQYSEQQLLSGHWRVEDAQSLFVRDTGMCPG